MRALVTGATGCIGSRLCRQLHKQGWFVRALVLPGEHTRHIQKFVSEFISGDITQPETLTGIGDDMDLVFHLAARVLDYGARDEFYEPIFNGTRHLLEACHEGANRFVFISSIAACGLGRHLKNVKESDPPQKSGIPYNDAKTDAEDVVQTYQDKFLKGCVIVRPANVIGPKSAWVDELGRQFLKSIVPLIDGGRHSASLIYVDNLVDGMILAGTKEKASGQIYHFRDDWDVTWKQYLTDLSAMLGKKPKGTIPYGIAWWMGVVFETLLTPLGIRPPATRLAAAIMGRNNDVDNSKAKKELGWKTRVSYKEAMNEIRKDVEKNLKPKD